MHGDLMSALIQRRLQRFQTEHGTTSRVGHGRRGRVAVNGHSRASQSFRPEPLVSSNNTAVRRPAGMLERMVGGAAVSHSEGAAREDEGTRFVGTPSRGSGRPLQVIQLDRRQSSAFISREPGAMIRKWWEWDIRLPWTSSLANTSTCPVAI